MKRILVFGGSSSKNSINREFATFAASNIPEFKEKILDLNDFEMPIFSVDKERELGIPEAAYQFKQEILNADGIVMSLAEHNGSYSAAFKNIYDWVSRIPGNMWEDKPVLLLATSPGGRGGKSVLESAKTRLPFQGANVIASFSLPSFKENFSKQNGISHPGLQSEFMDKLELFKTRLLT